MKKIMFILPLIGAILGTTPAFAIFILGETQKVQVEVGRTQAERDYETGQALGRALGELAQTNNITKTKSAALAAWVGGKKKICKPCYDTNLDLKQRVELTTIIALQFQGVGYSLIDSIESAKTAVLVDKGTCYIRQCQIKNPQ